jgi:hypothetical protein
VLSGGVESPFSGNAFEFLVSTVGKLDAGACHEVLHCSGDENLSRLSQCGNPRANVNGDSGELPALSLTLASVQSRTNAQATLGR